MTGLVKYFTALTAVSLIGVIVISLIKDQKIRNILRIICGILLLLVLLKPVVAIDLGVIGAELGQVFQEEFQTQDYEALYKDKLRQQVQSLTEEYVRNKASSMGGSVSVQVILEDDGYPTPKSIWISGVLTGEQRRALQDYVTRELGIPMENQRWELYE